MGKVFFKTFIPKPMESTSRLVPSHHEMVQGGVRLSNCSRVTRCFHKRSFFSQIISIAQKSAEATAPASNLFD